MRRGRNHDGTFVDIGLLRDHVSKLRRQQKTADDLYASVIRLIRLTGDDVTYQHTALRRDTKEMCEYYDQMIRVLNYVEDEAEYASYRISHEIEDNTDQTRHTLRKNLML